MTGLQTILIMDAHPDAPDATMLMDLLSDRLAEITGDGGRSSFDAEDVLGERACFVIAREEGGAPVGCGAYRPIGTAIAEIKRMYAAFGTKGVGSRILRHLEHRAKADGYEMIWLETRKINTHAVQFYQRHGYRPIENFGKYVGRAEAVCFGKSIADRNLSKAGNIPCAE